MLSIENIVSTQSFLYTLGTCPKTISLQLEYYTMNTITAALCLVVVALALPTIVVGNVITFWSDVDFRGDEFHIEMDHGHCYKLGISNDRMSSMDTNGQCVDLYTRDDCNGGMFRLEPGSACHRNFGNCDMNDRISSVRLCSRCSSCGCGCNNNDSSNNNNNNNYNY